MGERCTNWVAWLFVLSVLVYINVAVWPMFDEWVYSVRSVGEILPQVWDEYFTWNGRIVNTVLARVYSLLPVWMVDALIVLGWVIYLLLIAYLALGRQFREGMRHWYTILLVWGVALFFILDLWFTSTWHTGTTSYLWTANLAMGFMAVFRERLGEDEALRGVWSVSGWRLLWVAPLAVLAGWSNYNIGPAVLVLFGVFVVWKRREIKPLWPVVLLLILIGLGAVLMNVAPGNMLRSVSMNRGEIDWWFCVRRNVMQLQFLTCHYLPMAVLAGVGAVCRVWGGRWSQEDTRVVVMAVGGAVLATVAYVPSPVMPTGYSFHFVGTMYAVAVVRVLYPWVHEARGRWVWRGVLLVACVLPVCVAFSRYRDYGYSYGKLKECYALIEAQKGTGSDVILPRQRVYEAFPWRDLTAYWGIRQVGAYLGQLHAWCSGLGLGTDPNSHFNRAAARAWGLRSVRMPYYQASYAAVCGGMQLDAKEFEVGGEWMLRGVIRGAMRPGDRLWLHVAVPRRLRGGELLRAYARRHEAGERRQSTYGQLVDMGYEIRSVELVCCAAEGVELRLPMERSWVVASPWVAIACSPEACSDDARQQVYVPLQVIQNESSMDFDPETGRSLP